jgi:hypothetical protein
MNVVLTNLILWPFVFLVALPLIIHLFARSRPPVYRFSSVDFILHVLRRTVRVKRPQDWILLVLRTLLFASVIFMFLMPLFFSGHRLSGRFERKNVVVIMDATASMGCAEGGRTRFAAACAQASDILSGLTSRDTANIVWLRARPVAEFPAMGVNVGALQMVLRRAQVSSESGNVEEALRMALDLLEGAEGRREVHVLSDFQKTQWEGVNLRVPPGVELIKIRIGKEWVANGALSDIYTDPPRPLVTEEVSLCCEVQNFSAQPVRRTVYLGVQESRQSQDVMVPAWGRATAMFKYRFPAAGVFPVSATLSEDLFAGDDARWGLVEVRDTLRVGILARDSGTADAWRRVLEAVGWARVEKLAEADLESSLPFDVVLLAGDNGAGVKRLHERLGTGTTVLWYPGTNIDAAVLASDFNGAACGAVPWVQTKEPYGLRVVAEGDEIFRIFSGGEHGNPAGGVVFARLELPSGVLPSASVLMSYADGIPALARVDRGGKLFLWNIPLGADQSDCAARMEFVPLFAEILLCSRARLQSSRGQDYLPGEPLTWQAEGEGESTELGLKAADGRVVPVAPGEAARVAFVQSTGPVGPGLYTWELQERTVGHATVNFPSVESDLRTLDLGKLGGDGAIGLTSGDSVRHLREGLPLWPWLLALALLWALLEGVAAVWAGRT